MPIDFHLNDQPPTPEPQTVTLADVWDYNAFLVALRTWMLDHTGQSLGTTSRELAYLDALGGRPAGFSGKPLDRNVTLYRRGR